MSGSGVVEVCGKLIYKVCKSFFIRQYMRTIPRRSGPAELVGGYPLKCKITKSKFVLMLF